MIDPEKTEVIFGPPGTGKTTRLLNTVDGLISEGTKPREICFVTFTRKAANEAKARAKDRFSLNDDDLPYFRTLHAMAFRQLGLVRSDVMGFSNYIDICRLLGLSITFKGAAEDGTITGLSKGDRLFFNENLSRITGTTLRGHWETKMSEEDIDWYELLKVQETLVDYKKLKGKMDFTDMLVKFTDVYKEVRPDVSILIVDEAQDLSVLQWRAVDLLSQDVEKVFIAGDDDQAIFRWAGADVETFINLKGKQTILSQSYRVPIKVSDEANRIVKMISHRKEKEWLPRDEEGTVEYCHQVDDIDMSEGTWLLLARNIYLLEPYKEHCLQMGYIFSSRTGAPVNTRAIQAIKLWEDLRKGKKIFAEEAKIVYDFLGTRSRVKYGFKGVLAEVADNEKLSMSDLRKNFGLVTEKIWHEALDKLSILEREYFLAALRRGEKPLREPRININTIHGVKGGEADGVVVVTDMAHRTYLEYLENPDDELRVWYVAFTRAKNSLHIILPTTQECIEV